VAYASHHIQHMQKALEQMNLKLSHVVSDITGLTGRGRGQPGPAGTSYNFPVNS